MSSMTLFCRRHRDRLGGRVLATVALLAGLAAGPAAAHYGDLTVRPGTTLEATFSIGSLSNGSALSTPIAAFAFNVEVNYPPMRISFGDFGYGLAISMTDLAFSNPSVGSFDLSGWEFEIVTPLGDAPLAADGSFSMTDHEVRIDKGLLSGNLVGFGPIARDFESDPLTLTLGSPLTGHADGNTSGGATFISLAIPFDHAGSLAAGGGLSIDVLLQGQLLADGRVEIIPEPSIWMLLAFGVAALGVWQRRRRR